MPWSQLRDLRKGGQISTEQSSRLPPSNPLKCQPRLLIWLKTRSSVCLCVRPLVRPTVVAAARYDILPSFLTSFHPICRCVSSAGRVRSVRPSFGSFGTSYFWSFVVSQEEHQFFQTTPVVWWLMNIVQFLPDIAIDIGTSRIPVLFAKYSTNQYLNVLIPSCCVVRSSVTVSEIQCSRWGTNDHKNL